jgi:hypothetical protein
MRFCSRSVVLLALAWNFCPTIARSDDPPETCTHDPSSLSPIYADFDEKGEAEAGHGPTIVFKFEGAAPCSVDHKCKLRVVDAKRHQLVATVNIDSDRTEYCERSGDIYYNLITNTPRCSGNFKYKYLDIALNIKGEKTYNNFINFMLNTRLRHGTTNSIECTSFLTFEDDSIVQIDWKIPITADSTMIISEINSLKVDRVTGSHVSVENSKDYPPLEIIGAGP